MEETSTTRFPLGTGWLTPCAKWWEKAGTEDEYMFSGMLVRNRKSRIFWESRVLGACVSRCIGRSWTQTQSGWESHIVTEVLSVLVMMAQEDSARQNPTQGTPMPHHHLEELDPCEDQCGQRNRRKKSREGKGRSGKPKKMIVSKKKNPLCGLRLRGQMKCGLRKLYF